MEVFIKKLAVTFFVIIVLSSISSFVYAQNSGVDSLSSISLQISPERPRVGESVSILIKSNTIDLSASKTTWYVDGVIVKNTSNGNLLIKMKKDGQPTLIKAVVETKEGMVKQVSNTISPLALDFVVEPISYSMPFYKGKPYFAPQGTVKVVALPDIYVSGTKISFKDLNFVWSINDIILGDESGFGRNTLVVYGQIPNRDINISVKILDNLKNILVENSVTLKTNNMSVLFYENSPLYGILYNKSINNFYDLGDRGELNVIAKPFSFNFITDDADNSEYYWSINGNSVNSGNKKNAIILMNPVGTKGTASISLSLNNSSTIFQTIINGFNVSFGQ